MPTPPMCAIAADIQITGVADLRSDSSGRRKALECGLKASSGVMSPRTRRSRSHVLARRFTSTAARGAEPESMQLGNVCRRKGHRPVTLCSVVERFVAELRARSSLSYRCTHERRINAVSILKLYKPAAP